ncbi:MAG: hypothetical protein MJZ55_00225 [Paludibacteraceae bacterium]|nr:hypothetical protein [Paludibacteraceae bacterium]
MALDLGTLGVRIEAQVGDTVNRLNAVHDAVNDIGDAANGLKVNLDVSDLANAQREINDVTNALAGVDLNLSGDVDINTSGAEGSIDDLANKLDGFNLDDFFKSGNLGELISKLGDDGLMGVVPKLTALFPELGKAVGGAFPIAGAAALASYIWGDDVAAGLKLAIETLKANLDALKATLSTGWALEIQLDRDVLDEVENRVKSAEERIGAIGAQYDDFGKYAARYGWDLSEASAFKAMSGLIDVDLESLGMAANKMAEIWLDEKKAAKAANWGISQDDTGFEQLAMLVSVARNLEDTEGAGAGFAFLGEMLSDRIAQNLMPWVKTDADVIRSVSQQYADGGVYLSETDSQKFLTVHELDVIGEQLGIAAENLKSLYSADELIAYREQQNAYQTAVNQQYAAKRQYNAGEITADELRAYEAIRDAEHDKLLQKQYDFQKKAAELEAYEAKISVVEEKLEEATTNVAIAEATYEETGSTAAHNAFVEAQTELSQLKRLQIEPYADFINEFRLAYHGEEIWEDYYDYIRGQAVASPMSIPEQQLLSELLNNPLAKMMNDMDFAGLEAYITNYGNAAALAEMDLPATFAEYMEGLFADYEAIIREALDVGNIFGEGGPNFAPEVTQVINGAQYNAGATSIANQINNYNITNNGGTAANMGTEYDDLVGAH